jgi:hypothetical protein
MSTAGFEGSLWAIRVVPNIISIETPTSLSRVILATHMETL